MFSSSSHNKTRYYEKLGNYLLFLKYLRKHLFKRLTYINIALCYGVIEFGYNFHGWSGDGRIELTSLDLRPPVLATNIACDADFCITAIALYEFSVSWKVKTYLMFTLWYHMLSLHVWTRVSLISLQTCNLSSKHTLTTSAFIRSLKKCVVFE